MATLRRQLDALQLQVQRQDALQVNQRRTSTNSTSSTSSTTVSEAAPPSTTADPGFLRANIRFPPFWPHNPVMWFNQVEAQFHLLHIDDEQTRFRLVIAHLEPQYASKVDEVINGPPDRQPYQHLKTTLVQRNAGSDDERLRAFWTDTDMGDRKPSEYLRYLRSLVGPDLLPDSTLRKLWSQRLPPHVLSAIAALRDTDLTTVAEIADGVFENTSRPQVSCASSDSCAALQDIQRQLAELRDKLSNSKPENRRHSPSRRPPDCSGK